MTKPVERFEFVSGDLYYPPQQSFMANEEDGDYVKFEDYDTLRQQLESAQTEINNQAKAYGLLNQQLEVAQKESNTHKLLRDEAHNTYDAAMVTIGDILGIDVRDEPRCKWVALGASKIMRKLAQCEADARRYREPSFDFWAITVNGKVDVCGLSILRNINYSATEELQDEIERYLNEEVENLPQNAVIDFIATNVSKEPGQQTFPETGQWDFLPYWDMDIEITKIEVESTAIAAEGAGDSHG